MENTKKVVTYTYSEVLQSIRDGINLWDFAIKFGIVILERGKILEFLLQCTNNNKISADMYFDKLMENSEKYTKEAVDRSEVLNYNTLLYLLKKGYSRIEIMKRFGKTSYSSFSNTLRSIYTQESIDDEHKNVIKKSLFDNSQVTFKVSLIPNESDTKEINEINIEPNIIPNVEADITETKNIEEVTPEETLVHLPSNTQVKEDEKLILYTIEYLTQVKDLDDEFSDPSDERVILSCTLAKYVHNKSVSEELKIKLSNAINSGKLRVLIANIEYGTITQSGVSLENDIVISQALMLSRHTHKKIYIATCSHRTAINALCFDLGIRCLKTAVSRDFCDITDEYFEKESGYFDFDMSYNIIPENLSNKPVVFLDSCILIQKENRQVISDKSHIKLLPRIVVRELGSNGADYFFSTLFSVKYNDSMIIDLSMHLNYCYNDMAILNHAMHYQITTGKEVIIFTHDKNFYLEALKYNMKAKYYPSTYMNTFEEEVSNEVEDLEDILPIIDQHLPEGPKKSKDTTISTITETKNEQKDIVYHQTVTIQKVSSKPVIMDSNRKITSIISGKTLAPIHAKGHKGLKYYSVELGDIVTFKNDPNFYKLVALHGKNNLESVDLTKLNVKVV